ncbi:hypothetical protein E1B28_012917 [Marasmius oreades]|uniref:Uncharacterized protein n=1 Tax=Marasmius oreades TaxID=181124 RepID=A0A9P7RTK5_9AGAR|nr:uncharacterized protein E1B28_012917 [Marasmius oreades]KAG7088971.1 hypothetical protein E1B28_012917 [Marasmius oreades]
MAASSIYHKQIDRSWDYKLTNPPFLIVVYIAYIPTNMKISKSLLAIPFLVTSVLGQASYIRVPSQGATLHQGQSSTLQIVRPNSLQGFREAGLAVGILHCGAGTDLNPCPSPGTRMGTVLYTGIFDPQIREIPGNPYQNLTLTLPLPDVGGPPVGNALLQVSRMHLIGAGPSVVLEQNSVAVVVQA